MCLYKKNPRITWTQHMRNEEGLGKWIQKRTLILSIEKMQLKCWKRIRRKECLEKLTLTESIDGQNCE